MLVEVNLRLDFPKRGGAADLLYESLFIEQILRIDKSQEWGAKADTLEKCAGEHVWNVLLFLDIVLSAQRLFKVKFSHRWDISCTEYFSCKCRNRKS